MLKKQMFLLLIASSLFAQSATPDRLAWWREARFGMFIHWGLYAVPAGEWKGQPVSGIGEWIMNRAKIPVAEYELLAKQFNPVKFDAEEWVRIAKAAGQRYMVITSKHHDGFAMWHSKASEYNVYDATPYHRDPIAELAAACRRNGMKLGFYYSQTQDWHEPDGDGNTWDFDPAKKDFSKYLREKVVPQVRELLTEYGPVSTIWFDTPKEITPAQSKELVDLVHSLQPDCLVNGRIGNDMGDFRDMDDNQIPAKLLNVDWETSMTLNDTWGYKKNDHNWKEPKTLIRQLVDVASKGGVYQLNVGPTADGIIPPPSVERLRSVGDWLKVNGEAVYGTKPSPYPYEFQWGSLTAKAGRLYVHIMDWPKAGQFTLYGLSNKVTKAYTLASRGKAIPFSQKTVAGRHELHLKLPAAAPDARLSVIALEMEGLPEVERALVQQPDGKVKLPCAFAQADGPRLNMDGRGVVQNWQNPASAMAWDFKLYRPGTYEVVVITSARSTAVDWAESQWIGDHQVKVTAGGHDVEGVIKRQGDVVDTRNPNFRDVRSVIGRITLASAGDLHLKVQATKINPDRRLGFRLREIQLVSTPAKH